MRNLFILLVFLLSPVILFSQTATVNLGSEKQLIRGYGGMNHPSWGVDLTASQRLTAFGNEAGQMGISVLRIYVDGDKNNWSRELATAKEAVRNGAIVFASPWNPPSSMTETFTRNGVANQRRLRYDQYAQYAQHLNDFVTYMKNNGVDLYAISVQNEPDFAETWTWWTPQEILRFMKENAGSINCRVIAPESFQYVKSMSDPILNDPQALANMDILGAHLYGTSVGNFPYPLFESKGAGKELWMTEVYYPNSNDNTADLWPEALEVGYHIHNAMVEANFQAYVWWYIRRQYGLMKEDGSISKRGYNMVHFSKFVRPGYIRVDATKIPTTDVYLSAYKKGNDVVMVVVNRNTTAKSITVNVPGVKVPRWERYVTSATKNLFKEANINATTSFQITLDAKSITTIVGNMDFGTPLLQRANPENNSFDLPLSTNTFHFFYDNPVDRSKAKAKLVAVGQTDTVDLLIQGTGFSDTLTYKLPKTVSLTKGNYQITLSGLISDKNLPGVGNDSIRFLIGSPENPTPEIFFEDKLDGGGLVPKGWKITYGSTVREQYTTYSQGPRLMDFPNGGKFNSAFYLRDEGDTCRLQYGTYDDSRLNLRAGTYTVSFYYSWWTQVAKTNNLKINFAVKSTDGTTVFEQKDISTTNLIANTSMPATNSTLCTFPVDIPASGEYILEWRTHQFGFEGALVGGIKMTLPMTISDKYNYQLSNSLANAIEAKLTADSILYDGKAKSALIHSIETYSSDTLTGPTLFQAAIEELNVNATWLLNHKKAMDAYLAGKKVADERMETYAESRYRTLSAYTKLVNFVTLYNAPDYDNDALLASAADSLNKYASLVTNYVEHAVPALTYRVQKAVELAEKMGVTQDLSVAKNTMIDNDIQALLLKGYNKTAIENALTSGALRFGDSSTDPTLTDSLDMTGYIKNPNFYSQQTSMYISGTTFPGWRVPTVNASTAMGPGVLATVTDPVVDTHVRLGNATLNALEQTVTGLPSGMYTFNLNTRIPSGLSSNKQVFVYVVANLKDTLKVPMRVATSDTLLTASITGIKITTGSMKVGVRVGAYVTSDPVIRWDDATLWMVGPITTTDLKPTQTTKTVKEIRYYSLTGQRIDQPNTGFYLIKILYEDGSVEVQKVVKNR